LAVVLSLGLLLLFAPAVLGQEPKGSGVALALRGVTPGEVLGKPRRFAPVTVVVSNDGPREVEGLLRVYRRIDTAQGPSAVPEQGLFYERPLKLPRGARRTETVFYYCQDHEPDRLCVAFEAPGSDAVVLYPKLELTDNLFVLSLTSSDADEATKLGGGTFAGPKRPYKVVVKRGDVAALPTRAEGFAPFDLLVLSDLDPRSLSPAQVQALRGWVLGGGDLLVAFSGKAAEGLGGFDDSLLPVTALPGPATEERDVRPLQALAPTVTEVIEKANMVVKRVRANPGTRVLLGSTDAPLVVRGRAGAGRVTYAAFPLAAIANWPGARSVLELALRPPVEEIEVSRIPAAPPLEEALLNLTEALRTLEPPSALLIGPLLSLYVALVAPLNFVVLSRLGRRSFAYVTAAVIALVFGALFYVVGWIYKGSHALVARAAIVDLASSPDLPSRVDSLTGFFSTDRGVVDGKGPSGAVLAPIAERSSGRAGRVLELDDKGFELRAVELDTWALRRFRSIRLAKRGAVVASLHWEGSHITGSLKNATDPPLLIEAPTLFVGSRCVELEDLAPGATLPVDAVPTDRPTLRIADRLLNQLSRDAYGARFDDSTTGVDPFDHDPRRRIRAMLERRAASLSPSPDAVPALLAGVISADVDGVNLEASAQLDVARALTLSETEVLVGATSELSLNGLLPRVLGGNGFEPVPGAEGAPPKLSVGANAEGFCVFEWRLPAQAERPLNPKSLDIRWTLSEIPDPDAFGFDLYDWTSGKFTALVAQFPSREGRYTVSKSSQFARFIEPATGTVRAQLRSKSTREVALEHLSLNIAGTFEAR
jgi:hypothetical protein